MCVRVCVCMRACAREEEVVNFLGDRHASWSAKRQTNAHIDSLGETRLICNRLASTRTCIQSCTHTHLQ